MEKIPDWVISRLDASIAASQHPLIVGHSHPDGDAVGSCLALKHYLSDCRGLQACICFEDPYPQSLAFLPTREDCADILLWKGSEEEIRRRAGEADLVFCLDANDFDRTGGMQDLLYGLQVPKILIDHHLNPAKEHFDLCLSETQISSASELLYLALLALPDIAGDPSRLPAPCRKAILTGITTDTNNFANSVFDSTFRSVSELIAAGTDREDILEHLYNEYSERRIRLMARLLQEMVITPEGVAYMILTAETARTSGIRDGETEGFVNIPLSIDRVKMSIFLREDAGHFRVSIRSKRGVSANRLAMECFHGGGHEQAAGGKLFMPQDIPAGEQAAAYIESVTKAYFGR